MRGCIYMVCTRQHLEFRIIKICVFAHTSAGMYARMPEFASSAKEKQDTGADAVVELNDANFDDIVDGSKCAHS